MFCDFDKKRKEKNVAVWGCGQNAKTKYKFILDYIKPVAIIDKREITEDNCFSCSGIPCIKPEKMKDYNIDIIIISIEDNYIFKQI